MSFRKTILILACLGSTTIAFAEEGIETKMVISVKGDTGVDDVHFEIDGDDAGFNLHDMQVGENRSIIDKSGKSILVTREENGYRFDVDGKTVNMPDFDAEHQNSMWVMDGKVEDVDIHVMHVDGEQGMPMMSGMSGMARASKMVGVMIISEKSIDEATQQQIKILLDSTGHGGDVRFVGGDESHGQVHGVRVIEKTVEVTN
jgi:hypothetical protein